MRCPICGFQNKEGSNFCKKCGNKLAGIENNNFAQNGKSPNTSNRNSSNKKTIISIIVVALVIIGLMVTLYLLFFDNSFFRDEEKKSDHKKDNSISSKIEDTTSGFNTNDETDDNENDSSEDSEYETREYTTSASSTITVPDVVGLMYSDAYTKMKDLNIDYNVYYQYSDVAYDFVISQYPTAGKTMSAGDKMTIYVSKGEDNFNNPDYSSSRGYTSYSSEYILYGSDSRIIDKSEVQNMDETKMELALNEIYARHGRKFNTKSIADYFNSKSWYHGTVEPEDFNESVFNSYEKSNRDMLVEVMKEKGYRD